MLLSGKSLKHDFIRFVSATMASQVVFSLYSMVDGLMVSIGVNEYAMSAVNLAIPFTNALFSIAVLFAVGSSTLIAIFIAQEKRREANALFSQNFATLLTLGAVITALVLLFLEPFAYLLGADEITLDYVKQYILGIAPFSVCYLVSYNLEVLVKTDGYPRYALFTVIGGCLTNCVLDYIAIFHLDMGVFGAAVATGISQLVTCISYFVHFFSKKCTFRLCKFRFDPHLYARILPIGLSDGVTELCTGLMIFLFNRTVLKCIGTDGVVTYTVIAYVTTIVINLMVGISQGSQPLLSDAYSRGETGQVRQVLMMSILTALTLSVLMIVCFEVFAEPLVAVFNSEHDPVMADLACQGMRLYFLGYLFAGFNIAGTGYLSAVGAAKWAMITSILRGVAAIVLCALVMAALFGMTGVWLAFCAAEAITAGVMAVAMKKTTIV